MPKNNLWGLTDGFILASGSPQRFRLLDSAGFTPTEVITADIDETPRQGELPARYVKRIAIEKAKNKGLGDEFWQRVIREIDEVGNNGK